MYLDRDSNSRLYTTVAFVSSVIVSSTFNLSSPTSVVFFFFPAISIITAPLNFKLPVSNIARELKTKAKLKEYFWAREFLGALVSGKLTL